MREVREVPDDDLIKAPSTWLLHVHERSAQLWFRPSDTERQLAEHCVRYAYEILRLRNVIRSIAAEAEAESAALRVRLKEDK